MEAVVAIETLLLVVLVVLVAGLLRSHAEILRRLGPDDGTGAHASASAVPAPSNRPTAAPGTPAPSLAGVTPAGDAVALDFSGAGPESLTLLAFLTTGCGTCAGFWDTLAEPRGLPAGVRPLVVARGSDREQPSRVRELAPAGVPVVMSSAAWEDYRVPGAPYFVLVERSVLGEGVATSWTALASLVRDAVTEERDAAGASDAAGGAVRARRIDDTLAAGGITADHPSLYPAGR